MMNKRPPPSAMVVCPQPEAAEAGIDILKAGGNAADAAVACAFAQTVVDPLMCGIAGFGTAAVYRSGSGVHEYVDFHSPAPLAARADMWAGLLEGETRDGFGYSIRGRHNDLGFQSMCTPATLLGLKTLHEAHGRLPWSVVLEPAVQWAREGFFVRPAMHAFFVDKPLAGRASNLERIQLSPAGREFFCQEDGSPKSIGSPMRNMDYADLLLQIGREGIETFYRGEVAHRMIDHLRANGGILGLEDLASLTVRRNAPLESVYRDRRVTTNRPPGGGAMLIEMLNILESFPIGEMEHNCADYMHLLSEVMKQATVDKDRYIGDPDFVAVPLDRLLSKSHAAEIAQSIRDGRSVNVPRLDSGPPPPRDTTHVSVVDGNGDCVALTHSLAMPSGVITPGLGFMYNGGMGVFDPRPGRTGSIAPGKSRFTASCPSIIFKDGRPEIILGAPGGTQIVMGVLQALLNVIDFGMDMQSAVSAPRFSSTSNLVDVSNRIPRAVTRELTRRYGTEVVRNPFGYTIAWVHGIRLVNGIPEGGADPGRDGVAYAI